jgi:hypothetical protein
MAVERQGPAFDDSAPPVRVTYELVLVGDLTLADYGADYSIETGAVAAPGQYSDSHWLGSAPPQ